MTAARVLVFSRTTAVLQVARVTDDDLAGPQGGGGRVDVPGRQVGHRTDRYGYGKTMDARLSPQLSVESQMTGQNSGSA
jgi:hypothetical protein